MIIPSDSFGRKPIADIRLNEPHSQKQWDMITYPGSVAAFCGRRFGKTDGYVQRIFYWMRQDPGLYWWVGLSWQSASMKRAWRGVTDISRQVLAVQGLREREHINRSRHEIILPGLGEIWFRTADNPASLAGEGIKGAVIDEYSLMQSIVWEEYLEATLLDYEGWAAFGGVPKGNNWAAMLWQHAADRDGWLQVHATTYENPYINPAAIDRIKANTPERFFQQEYMAEIIDDAGGVFRGVMAAATAEEQSAPIEGHEYVFGVDWGKHLDYTVIAIIDATEGECVGLDRFNQIDYRLQVARLQTLYEQFRPSDIIAERNAMGEPLIERLHELGMPVTPFLTTNRSKADAVDALSLSFERGTIKIVPDPVLVSELQAFQAERLPSGLLRYNAPEGMHDDTVMALCMGWYGVAGAFGGPAVLEL